MSDDTRTFTIFIIARLFSSYILLGHFEWSGFERKLGDFQTFSGMLANVWFSSETFPERCGSGGHGEIEKLIRAVLFPLSPRVGWSKEKKNILLQDIFQIVKNIFFIKKIARAGKSDGNQVFLKTEKYCKKLESYTLSLWFCNYPMQQIFLYSIQSISFFSHYKTLHEVT